MYLDSIRIKNYRNFSDFTCNFNDGLNVFVGSNNSGKTGLLKAISLINNLNSISIHDFNLNDTMRYYLTTYKQSAPCIEITYSIKHVIQGNDYTDETFIVLQPFISIENMESRESGSQESNYNLDASIKMVFSINAVDESDYINETTSITTLADYLEVLEKYFNKYSWKFFNGHTMDKVDKAALSNIVSIDFIEAERNNDEIYKETKREINEFFNNSENNNRLKDLEKELSMKMKETIKEIFERIDNLISNEKNDIGLKNGYVGIQQVIKSKSSISDSYLINVRDTKNDYILPMSHNGLGYNNLINIYMLLKLVKKNDKSDFNILCLEEPEAHLHPAMQYKLFKYIRNLDKNKNLGQQIFVSTHSSNISAVASLENIILIDYQRNSTSNDVLIQSMKSHMLSKPDSNKHMTKFLDVTRSDMLFTDKIILVEGIAEKLLMPLFLKRLRKSYEDEHISIVEIGGKNFNYFLDLFHNNSVAKKVLVITDRDFNWYDNNLIKSSNEYISYSPTHLTTLLANYNSNNIKFVTQSNFGSTFEDELFMDNSCSSKNAVRFLEIALPISMQRFINENQDSFYKWGNKLSSIPTLSRSKISSLFNTYKQKLSTDISDIKLYKTHFFSQLFYDYSKNKKGDIALSILTDDFLLNNIVVPLYIKEGLKWLLR